MTLKLLKFHPDPTLLHLTEWHLYARLEEGCSFPNMEFIIEKSDLPQPFRHYYYYASFLPKGEWVDLRLNQDPKEYMRCFDKEIDFRCRLQVRALDDLSLSENPITLVKSFVNDGAFDEGSQKSGGDGCAGNGSGRGIGSGSGIYLGGGNGVGRGPWRWMCPWR